MPCQECRRERPIVNVKYHLCANCNSIRLTGKSLVDRNKESVLKSKEKAKAHAKPINRFSKKEAPIKEALSKLKQQIREEAINKNTYRCCGCGITNAQLDCSHILSVGMFKKYELVKDNIQLLCRSCHNIWQDDDIVAQMNLRCFADNLRLIRALEPLEYQKFITRLNDKLPYFYTVCNEPVHERKFDAMMVVVNMAVDEEGFEKNPVRLFWCWECKGYHVKAMRPYYPAIHV